MFGLHCELRHRLEFRLEQKAMLQAPAPPDAATGIKGLSVAHALLLSYRLPGLLIGGVARQDFLGRNRKALVRKDLDVVVLRRSDGVPERFEGGIDWWLPDDDGTLVNGNGADLIYTVKETEPLSAGLHLCPEALLRLWRQAEYEAFSADRRVSPFPFDTRHVRLLNDDYPSLCCADLTVAFRSRDSWRMFG